MGYRVSEFYPHVMQHDQVFLRDCWLASKGIDSKIARHIFKEVGVRSELYEKEKTPGLLGFTM